MAEQHQEITCPQRARISVLETQVDAISEARRDDRALLETLDGKVDDISGKVSNGHDKAIDRLEKDIAGVKRLLWAVLGVVVVMPMVKQFLESLGVF